MQIHPAFDHLLGYVLESLIAVHRINVKPLRHNTACDPSMFNVAVAICHSRLYM